MQPRRLRTQAHSQGAHLHHLWRRELRRELHGACRAKSLQAAARPFRLRALKMLEPSHTATECGSPLSFSRVGFRCRVGGTLTARDPRCKGPEGLRSSRSFTASQAGLALPHAPGAYKDPDGTSFSTLHAHITDVHDVGHFKPPLQQLPVELPAKEQLRSVAAAAQPLGPRASDLH